MFDCGKIAVSENKAMIAAPQYTVASLKAILTEELEPFFAGDKTSSEAASIIQNRAQLYLDENTK